MRDYSPTRSSLVEINNGFKLAAKEEDSDFKYSHNFSGGFFGYFNCAEAPNGAVLF